MKDIRQQFIINSNRKYINWLMITMTKYIEFCGCPSLWTGGL